MNPEKIRNLGKDAIMTDLSRFWLWLNTLVHRADEINEVGLATHAQLWISRLVIQHRFLFQLVDEVKLVFILLKLPTDWLAEWAASLIHVHVPDPADLASIKHFLFVLEVAICSHQLREESIPCAPDDSDISDEQKSRQSSSSSDFSVLDDDDLLGGGGSDSPNAASGYIPVLGSNDLTAVLGVLRLEEVIDSAVLPLVLFDLVETINDSIILHSASSSYSRSISLLCSYLERMVQDRDKKTNREIPETRSLTSPFLTLI